MPVAAGQLLGRYRLSRRVGSGGMAEVWEAVDESLHRTVALKVILEAVSREPTFAERFVREARTIAGLEHPNILPVYDFGQDGEIVYLVMPLVSGGSLKDRLGKTVPAPSAIGWISAIASALDYAHARGILHRDVKPANVLLDQSDRALLSDFGLAKSLGDSTAGLTATGAVMGTPTYMSPEQAMALTLDGRSDQYSLGIISFQLFAGVVPFTADSPLVVLRKHLQEPPPPASRVNPRLTPAIDRALERALAKDPAERYPRCEDLAGALASACRGAPEPTADPTPRSGSVSTAAKGKEATTLWSTPDAALEPTVRSKGSAEPGYVTALQTPRRRLPLAAGAAVAVLAAAAALFVLLRRPERNAPPPPPAPPLVRAAPSPVVAAPVAPTGLPESPPPRAAVEPPAAPAIPGAKPAPREAIAKTSRPPAVERPRLATTAAPPSSAAGDAWSEAFESGQRAMHAGNYRAAEASFREALGQAEGFGPKDPRLARTLQRLGSALANLARFPEAEELLRRALQLKDSTQASPLEVADSKMWLGFVLSRQGRPNGEAETLLQEALAAKEKALGADDPAVAFALQQLGYCYEMQGRHLEAEKQLRRGLAILDARPGENELIRAGLLNDLGWMYLREEQPAQAERPLKEAVAIRERKLPPDHPHLALSQFHLAEAEMGLQNYAQAESLLRKSLAIREKSLGPNHPATAATLRQLAQVLRLQHRDSEADRYQAQARAIRAHNHSGGD
jgi:tetratricopeptide (TPR) repeat protein